MVIFIIITVWLFSILNVLKIIKGMDGVDSLLLAIAITVLTLRYKIRLKNNGKKKLSI
ncbi:MAG: hypothetical protein HXY47_06835 [Nitrospirae bacterium]|nr:hypothetical protein [Nitrospirota bacterium]